MGGARLRILRITFYCAIVALLIAPAIRAQQGTQPPAGENSSPPPDEHTAAEQAAERQALGFLQYLDQGRYADSYAYTSKLIRSKLDRDQFAKDIEKDRAPMGAKESRELTDAHYTTQFPDAPAGQYVVLHYRTNFAKKKGEVETVILTYERGYWRVAGWNRQ
jgi:hypothetical protein